MAENAEISIVGGGSDIEKVKRSLFTSQNLNGAMRYLIFNAKQALIQLRQAFTKALIFWHFDLKYYIRIETNASGYAIGGVLS